MSVPSVHSQNSGSQDSITITRVYLAVFELNGSPYSGDFRTLDINGLNSGLASITSIDVRLGGNDLGVPPLWCCQVGSGQTWIADYSYVPFNISVGQTYQITLTATLSDGQSIMASFEATAVACDSLLACPGSTPIPSTSIVATASGVAPSTTSSSQANCISSNPANSFGNQQLLLAYGIAQTNLWNLQGGQGEVTQCYASANGLTTSISLSDISLRSSGSNIPVGYPEAAYGHNYYGVAFGVQSPSFEFPMQVSALSADTLFSNVSYSITSSHLPPLDFGYDLWIEGESQGTPATSDYELLILFSDSFGYASSSAQNLFSNEIYVNSQPTPVTWNVYTSIGGGTNAKLVIFSLGRSNQLLGGTVSVKPNDFISYLATDLAKSPLSSYRLRGVELGSEFGNPSSNQVELSWSISSFSLNDKESTVYIIGSSTSSSIMNTSSIQSNSSAGGGIPEFPYQLAAAAFFMVLITASYLMVRHRTPASSNARVTSLPSDAPVPRPFPPAF